MPKDQMVATAYTAPKFKFLKTWQDHKKLFEKNTSKKKPSEKGFLGLYRKSAGIEPAFELLDKVLAEIPIPIPEKWVYRRDAHILAISSEIQSNTDKQLKWVNNFNKAFTSFTKNCEAYEKLLDKSADDDEYKLFAQDVKDLKKALKGLAKAATVYSQLASSHHKQLTTCANKIDKSKNHFTTISVEVKALNVILKAFRLKPLVDEESATLKKDIAAAVGSIKKAAEAKKAGASKSSDLKMRADAEKKVVALTETIDEATRFLGDAAVRINESFSGMIGGFDAV